MPTRPKIPAEVKRQVRGECGDCCAVCGSAAGLEFAHISPWSKSKDHSAENLIYLCAPCHARAYRENWSEKQLRRLKEKPWFIRKEWEPPAGRNVKVTINVTEAESNDRGGIDIEQYVAAALAGYSQAQMGSDSDAESPEGHQGESKSTLTQSGDSGKTPSEGKDLVMDDSSAQRNNDCTFHRRALFALRDLPTSEQVQVRDKLKLIAAAPDNDLLALGAHKLETAEPLYLIEVNDSLRLIVRAEPSEGFEVLDLVRHDTLKTFGALQDAK